MPRARAASPLTKLSRLPRTIDSTRLVISPKLMLSGRGGCTVRERSSRLRRGIALMEPEKVRIRGLYPRLVLYGRFLNTRSDTQLECARCVWQGKFRKQADFATK